MADQKISALTSYTTPLAADLVPIVDTANTTTKQSSMMNFFNILASLFRIKDSSDTSKQVAFSASGITTATTRTITVPDSNTTLPIASQVLTFSGPSAARTITLPDASITVARTDAANTFTGTQTVSTLAAPSTSSININSGTNASIQTYNPTGGGTATLDLSKGNIHHITMPAGNITIALSNGTAGQCFIIRILQDGTGSRTVTWFTTIKWAGGSAPILTTTASKADTVGFEITGSSTYDGFVIGQNI
jgi:hypothetical protein